MFYKAAMIVLFILPYSALAQDSLKTDVEALFDYRSDQLRENVNTNSSSIRNFSIRTGRNLDEKSLFLIELLGDEGLSTEGVDFSLGEFYYNHS